MRGDRRRGPLVHLSHASRSSKPIAHLLANYDEYVVGLADRSAMTARLENFSASDVKQLVFANVVLVDGQVVGTWARGGRTKSVELELVAPVTATERRAIDAAVERYTAFTSPA